MMFSPKYLILLIFEWLLDRLMLCRCYGIGLISFLSLTTALLPQLLSTLLSLPITSHS